MTNRCDTCGRPRGLAQQRKGWGIHPLISIPRTGSPEDHPRQCANEVSCSASVARNGGYGERSHLCDDCLRVGVRALKVQLSEVLAELDSDHDKDAEIAELTSRLSALQHRHYNVCFDHDRMQDRLGELLKHVSGSADPDVVRVAEWEASRGRAQKDGE